MSRFNFDKIELNAQNTRFDLNKKITASNITANLNWSPLVKRPSAFAKMFLGAKPTETHLDLDLGCLIRLKSGELNCVQPLGGFLGNYDTEPYVSLSGDDRMGLNDNGETMSINGLHWDEIDAVLVFACIYEGAPNWNETNAILTVECPDFPEISVSLGELNSTKPIAAIALLKNQNGSISVDRLHTTHRCQQSLDQYYHWGLEWEYGSK